MHHKKETEANMEEKKKINNNGFEYVDLGLPSGTLWSTCNVGANNPSDYGLYFQWGDTQGWTADQVGEGEGQKRFLYDDYKWAIKGSFSTFSKYTTIGASLELEDDAAHAHMGGDWHMPSPTQVQELLDNTIRKWTILDRRRGFEFASIKDESKSIFIPEAGYAWNGLVCYAGDTGHIWTSMLNACSVNTGQYLYFDLGGTDIGNDIRSYGFSVRGVIG